MEACGGREEERTAGVDLGHDSKSPLMANTLPVVHLVRQSCF